VESLAQATAWAGWQRPRELLQVCEEHGVRLGLRTIYARFAELLLSTSHTTSNGRDAEIQAGVKPTVNFLWSRFRVEQPPGTVNHARKLRGVRGKLDSFHNLLGAYMYGSQPTICLRDFTGLQPWAMESSWQ
jgi:hypothetical protein